MAIILELNIPGSTEASLQAGLQAAAAHLRAVRIHPVTAERAARMLQGVNLDLLVDDEGMSMDYVDAARAWNDAEISAFVAALGVVTEIPEGSKLTVVHPPFSEKRESLVDFAISAPGASRDELRRGVEAAMEVFVRSGVSPLMAADGVSAVEWWDDRGFLEGDGPAEDEQDAAEIWHEAGTAAFRAIYPNSRETGRSDNTDLTLVWNPELYPATRSQALAMMRELVDRDGSNRSDLFSVACRAVASIEDGFRQQELANSVTEPYNDLRGRASDAEKDATVRAVFAAIDALEAATADYPDQLPIMSSAELFPGQETRPWTGAEPETGARAEP